ncbi:MAG: hypothetical protein ACYDD1_18575 [Caulobacteraceae bacterium]
MSPTNHVARDSGLGADVDLQLAAALLHRSYAWMAENWRRLVNEEGFPEPFVGKAKNQRPWWRRSAIEAWKDGARFSGSAPEVKREELSPANDPVRAPRKGNSVVEALLAAAGGSR